MWKDIVITIANILLICQYLWGWQYLWEYLWSGYLKSYIFRRFRSDPNGKFTHDFKDLANFVLKYPEKLENSLLIKTEKRLLENVNQSFQAYCSRDLNSLIEKRPQYFTYCNFLLEDEPKDPLKEILRPEYIVPRGSSPAKTIETKIIFYTKERMESDKFHDILQKDINNDIKEIFVAIEGFFLLKLMSFLIFNCSINAKDDIYDLESLKKKLGKLRGVGWRKEKKSTITIYDESTYWDLKRFKWNLEQEDFVKNLRIKVDRDRCKKQEKFAYKISIECDIYDVDADLTCIVTFR